MFVSGRGGGNLPVATQNLGGIYMYKGKIFSIIVLLSLSVSVNLGTVTGEHVSNIMPANGTAYKL